MAEQLFSLYVDGFLKLQRGVIRGEGVLRRPFANGRGEKCLFAVRNLSTHSVKQQFKAKTFVGMGGSTYQWKNTPAFGWREPPRETMVRTGKYQRAWIGGAGRFQQITDNRIEWGVQEAQFPQVKIHQRTSPFYIRANPSNRTARGRLKMQVKLFYLTGIYFSERFLLGRGFLMQPRRVGLNRSMIRSVIDIIQSAFNAAVRGGSQPTGGPSA